MELIKASLTGRLSKAALLAFVAGLAPQAAWSADHTHLGWDLTAAPLIRAQSPRDVASLATTISATNNFAHAMAAWAEGQKATAAVMIRLNYAGDRTYMLYRTADKAMVAEAKSDKNGRLVPAYLGEVPLAEWDSLFNKLRAYEQPEPTPMTRHDTKWPFGYGSVVHLYDNGATRTFLMAAEDIEVVDHPDLASDMLCRTVFAGLHCHPGPKTHDGWVRIALRELERNVQGDKQAGKLHGIFSESVVSCWKTRQEN